ncbi:MAG: DUF1549 domain-containing protein, partial [Planctomicrobium sp.]|nr:DUF1549 domain-containing protein [Planctomicrobium sp.]
MVSHNSTRLKVFVTVALALQLVLGTSVNAEESQEKVLNQTAAEKLFALKVYPLIKVKCFGCHGADPEDVRGDYDLLTREGMIKGGESEEPSLVPGHPDQSPLYDAVLWEGMEMPPKENDRLTKEETEQVRQWIAAGAPWPDADARHEIQKQEWTVRENADGVIVDTSGGIADDWTYRRYQKEDLWAFQPVNKPAIPEDTINPIDYFINNKLKEADVTPAEPAEFRTLVRRAYYDLTGLPPTADEVDALQKDWQRDRDKTWNHLIDHLLNSKHYGERWAQHWLDVVRYADTGGFSNDYERSNAWRFRDYVIRAFNDDKPINEFIIEQIAGDEFKPGDPEALIATGLLRLGPWGTAMVPQDEARQLYLDDLVHNVGQSFLSMPMRCCKCHDHKFDPLPTRDYYSMYSAFATTQPAEIEAAFLPEENRKGFEEK